MSWYPAPESDDEREERLRPEPTQAPAATEAPSGLKFDPRPLHEQLAEIRRRQRPSADVLNMVVGATPAPAVGASVQPVPASEALSLVIEAWDRYCSGGRTDGDAENFVVMLNAARRDATPVQPVQASLSDEQVMHAIINACDSLNITRVHGIGGPTRTICDETGLLEIGRAVLALASSTPTKGGA